MIKMEKGANISKVLIINNYVLIIKHLKEAL